ncbi:hypothetical protein [Candidatus Thiodiazotropha endoloripes]|uniref:Uncharacterized protein n=1 Tax=Candidatus Thiodiazotropha endoloripes TaxID=1818881 RepID=A0A1E2UQW8_9GAMM|nr:hypothetical protein [Candidatus Thiodiazotropha endoloripes]ODB97158.1 hypothetical protein A3196_10525 [Candidatus Thiodiazotropha endoloripes]
MKRLYQLLLTAILIFATYHLSAQTEVIITPINVSEPAKQGIFHHLESSGRQNIAVSGSVVSVVWEDDSDGTPRIYLSRKSLDSNTFSPKLRISGNGEAFEPSIRALGDGRFAIAWEEDEQVSARIVKAKKMGPIVQLGEKTSGHANLSSLDNQILIVYREQAQRFGRIILQKLTVDKQLHLSPAQRCPVEPGPLQNDQLYPVISVQGERVNIAWEDRRLGHTVIMHSQSEVGDSCRFSSPTRISEQPPGPRAGYGSGHGVARVALAKYGNSGVYAVWADKRDFREGYDIYGANKPNDQAFEGNVRIQDDFGTNYRQWHATISGHQNGQLIVAWTDEREGSKDVWYSWLEDGEWSDDVLLSGASGKGVQDHPSITLDSSGDLHVAWVHRETEGGATQIRYLYAPL